ncbi:Serine/threonine-protein kinase, active site [Sesbania bispinosa]|nr:Serine/threonine-protein kinase, active site [Sesbania bispinosa]
MMNLQYNQLSGNISSIIFNNSLLQYLALGQNNLFGNIPSNICQGLPNLRLLYLYANDISGEMPTLWHQCKELVDLELSFNNFNKGRIPGDIGNLTKLQYLYLRSNNLEGEIPFSLFNISSLRQVNLDKNYNLNGSLPHKMCDQLPQLEMFTLQVNQLEGSIPRSIGNCTSLKILSFEDNYFTGSIPMEIGNLDQLEVLQLGNNSLSGPIPSKLFNISTLTYLRLANNSLTGILPSDMGYGLPNLEQLHMYSNKLIGNIPNTISNSSKLTIVDLGENRFSGIIPNSFGDLTLLESLLIAGNNLTTYDSPELNFLTSLTSCRHLTYLEVTGNSLLSKLPKSIGNLSKSLEQFVANSCRIDGDIPLEIGNMSNLIRLSLNRNNMNGPMPATIKGLKKLQYFGLAYNGLQGSIIDELCQIRSLSQLYLTKNNLSGVLPTCLGNMTSLRKIYMGSNKLISQIPSSFWSLKDILEVNFSSNALTGNLPLEIGQLRALVLLDLSGNEISSNIPTTISFLKTLQFLSLAQNKLQGSIPPSLSEMVSLSFLDLSQNLLSGVIPKSLESLVYLKYINFSYNRLQGEIPDDGPFKNLTAQSFMHNEALCGNPRLQVPLCGKQDKRKKKVENSAEMDLSGLGALRRISYYELIQATNGFSESNLLGKGSFGCVYQGMLSNGKMVAIKVIDLALEATSKSFDAECNAMRNLRHRNLVKIISSCSNVDFKSLVMEFMSNGSLDKWLYSDHYCLDFLQRLNIMIDVASALEYLHHGSSIPVVHCDLKPSNVLLDENMIGHVSDFGIAKLLDEGQSKTHTETLATLGYIAPEYGSKGIVSIKGDVYSYGIMLMEVFTGKKPIDDSPEARLNMTHVTASLTKIKTLYTQY